MTEGLEGRRRRWWWWWWRRREDVIQRFG